MLNLCILLNSKSNIRLKVNLTLILIKFETNYKATKFYIGSQIPLSFIIITPLGSFKDLQKTLVPLMFIRQSQ
ncbi:hypothetical protein SACC_23990 [Saccharolobus caldissimus]|uniref:Uncharacterized protein n=1 Tax=Saccharolobus caldissimus TaxID=1702097 RepID=A0AAQ4CUA1_9CREN|nr:hypothetical protein SACC_23990 [Saccharolobus caldissimus]